MKKDISIPKVKDVGVAIIQEKEKNEWVWRAYLLNLNNCLIKDVLVSTRGYGTINDKKKRTSSFSHYLGNLNKNRLRRKKNFLVPINYIEYHFCYIINLESRYKLYNNKEDLMNCYIISPLFVFFNNKNNVNDINNVNILQDNNEENLSLVDKLKKSENYNKVLENVKYYNPFKNKKLF